MNMTQLTGKSVKELRAMAAEHNITGRWNMNKDELISALSTVSVDQPIEQSVEQSVEEEKSPARPSRRGRMRTIVVYKDGEFVKEIDGLIETFKWAEENKICNQGWIKHSLKTGQETVAGRKFKQGGYKFEYAK